MQQTSELVSKSIITPSMLETQRMVYLKQDYENSLGWDFSNFQSRERIIRLMRVLHKEMEYTLTAKEDTDLRGITEEITEIQTGINTTEKNLYAASARSSLPVVGNQGSVYKIDLKNFLDCAYDFLGMWNAAGVNHGLLGSKTKKNMSDFKKVSSAMESPNIMYNSFGIPVSGETIFYASHLVMRTYAKWDNVIFINGKPGVGKDTTGDAIATTMAWLSPVHQYKLENIFFKEGRKIIEDKITKADPFTIFKLAEAGNQIGSKTFYEEDQILFTNVLNWIRNSGLTIFICWKEMGSIDASLRKNRAINQITIKHRGTATVKAFNENPYATDATYTPKYLKKRVVISTQKASLLQLADPTTLLQMPIYNIDETEWWNQEEAKKNEGKKAFSSVVPSGGAIRPAAEGLGVFMREMKGAMIIEKTRLDVFNQKNSTIITLQQVADYMASQVGIDKKTFIVASSYVLLPKKAQDWLGALA